MRDTTQHSNFASSRSLEVKMKNLKNNQTQYISTTMQSMSTSSMKISETDCLV